MIIFDKTRRGSTSGFSLALVYKVYNNSHEPSSLLNPNV